MLRNALIALIVLQGVMNPLAVVEASPPLPDNAMLEELKAAKAYILDIRYGDTQTPFSSSSSSAATKGAFASVAPSQTFLDSADMIRIGLDMEESGTFDKAEIGVGYALTPEKDAPPVLRFAFLNADPDNFTSIQTRVTIDPNEWTTLSSTEFSTLSGEKRYSYIVVRLVEQ